MIAKKKHVLSFSPTPRQVVFGSPSRSTKSTPIRWDKRSLSRRAQFVLGLLSERAVRVHFEFVGPKEMGALNNQFRQKDRATDVLSFVPHAAAHFWEGGLEHNNTPVVNLGELAICVDVCAAQAKRHRCSLAEEIERMIVHGLIHLKGFDHERSPAAYAVMTALESSVRRELKRELGVADFCRFQFEQTVKKSPSKKGRGAPR